MNFKCVEIAGYSDDITITDVEAKDKEEGYSELVSHCGEQHILLNEQQFNNLLIEISNQKRG